MTEVDARGLSCPIPVLRAKEAMDADPAAEVSVLVDDEAAKENVSRLAAGRGYEVSVEKEGDEYQILARPKGPKE